MEKLFLNIRSIIAFSIVIFSFGYLFSLLFVAIPEANKTIVYTSAGLVLAGLGAVTSYYFGSSKNESDKAKTDQINRMDPPPAPSQSVVDQVIKQS